jgi:hypothetical protein
VLVAAALSLFSAGPALAGPVQLSSMQDNRLIDTTKESVVVNTLEKMQDLGVQVVRVNLEWNSVAPAANSYKEPKGFNALNEVEYSSKLWAPYDRLVFLARAFGIAVEFDITGPGPLWAMGKKPPTARAANHWYPNATDFGQFVYAVGQRYNAEVNPDLGVRLWSIWNEPNQPGWLAPQSASVHGKEVAESPRLYRALANAGYDALLLSGHTDDAILFGETAPEGDTSRGYYKSITPIPFLRDLYCVGSHDRQLSGTAATAIGCPADEAPAQFTLDNSVLFDATGFAHHPYDFSHGPEYSLSNTNDVPLANIGRLETFLDSTFTSYGIDRQIPIFFTEYGFVTNPPNPDYHVSPSEQATYLNESDYLAWKNPRIDQVAQYELYDNPPDTAAGRKSPSYWGDSFQTGLLFGGGKAKPAYADYRVEIWIQHPDVKLGASTWIWGLVRPANRLPAEPVEVQWRANSKKSWETVETTDTAAYTGYVSTAVVLPGRGQVRLAWPTTKAGLELSRTVSVG